MIRTHKVGPVGKRKIVGFVDSFDNDGFPIPGKCGLREIELPEYPPSRGEELRETRVLYKLGLSGTAGLLGWTVLELCEVERGSRAPEDWDAVFETLKKAKKEG